MGAPRGPVSGRFWRFVVKTETCWPWTGATTNNGYGVINDGTNKLIRAHRLSWVLHRGEIPEGMWVLHRCDNPPCVNPEHLFLGTEADNTRDMMTKGRFKKPPLHRGEKQHQAILSEEKVRIIRQKRREGTPGVEIARELGITPSLVSIVGTGRGWSHVVE